MRALLNGDNCAANEAGISRVRNPVQRLIENGVEDPHHAHQIHEGQMRSRSSVSREGPVVGETMHRQFKNHMQTSQAVDAETEANDAPLMNRPTNISMDAAWQEVTLELRDDTESGDFISAPSFAGSREGFGFKMGSQGLGYYRDGTDVIPATSLATTFDPGCGEWQALMRQYATAHYPDSLETQARIEQHSNMAAGRLARM